MSYFHNVTFVMAVFSVVYLLLKRVAYALYFKDWRHFAFVKVYYYWFEFILILTAAALSPTHSYNEGMFMVIVCMLIKVAINQLSFVDVFINKVFGRNGSENKP